VKRRAITVSHVEPYTVSRPRGRCGWNGPGRCVVELPPLVDD
jgi:hypothetical protein